jgi:hypothetical protein
VDLAAGGIVQELDGTDQGHRRFTPLLIEDSCCYPFSTRGR